VYVASLSGDVGFWDIGEMQTVPYILGTAHPTGYPAVILAGFGFTHMFPLGDVAWRMTLFCALCFVASALLLYSSVAVLLRDRSGSDEPGRASAWNGSFVYASSVVAGVVYAFSPLVWAYATHVDVFALNAVLAALAFRCLLEWRRSGSVVSIAVAALAAGLGLGAHLTALWLLPGFALMAFVPMRRSARSTHAEPVSSAGSPALGGPASWTPRATLAAAGSFVLGLAVYAYSPIASAVNHRLQRDPTLTLGLPPCRPFFDYGHPENLKNLLWMVTGARVNAPGSMLEAGQFFRHFDRLVMPIAVVARAYPDLVLPYTALAIAWLALAILGLLRLIVRQREGSRNDKVTAAAILLCAFGSIPFLAAFAAESDPLRYWLVPTWFISLLAGVGLAATVRRASKHSTFARGAALIAVALAFILIEQYGARSLYAQPHDHLGRTYIATVRALTPPNAILIVDWTPATPLAYAAYVDHSLGQRIVETSTLEKDAGYISHWLPARPIYLIEYQRPNVPGITLVDERRLGLSATPTDDAKLWRISGATPTALPQPDPSGDC
jgi:Protein of unknown function (DUF2723)